MTTPMHYAADHQQRFLDELKDLLRIPSISTDPAHATDVERAATWLVEDMRRIGMDARTYRAEGYLPLVYGEWLQAGADAPTVLLYGHYDVQPAELADGWATPPFEPVERDGKIYARGAVDSKSHVILQLKAIESMLATGNSPVNLKVLFEGEEESGSEHIYRFVADNLDLLRADVCVVSDGSMPDPEQPVLDYGLRGIVAMELIVTGPQRDLHSGHYGGVVHNPIQALAEIVARLHDDQGHVTVPGFYDSVRPLTDEERATLEPINAWLEKEWRVVANAPAFWGEPEYRTAERIGLRPTLELNGIYGGFTAEGVKTVLPAKATAKISCRLVPDQDPNTIYEKVRDYVTAITPPTVRSSVVRMEEGAPGVVFPRESLAMQAAAAAYQRGWGVDPLWSRAGGSIPVVSEFIRHLDSAIVLMPFGYKGGGAHSTNEYVVIDMFQRGIRTMLHFYEILAADFASGGSAG